jgi:hypothetical protein
MAGRTTPIRYADVVNVGETAAALAKQSAPSAERNKDVLLGVLRQALFGPGHEQDVVNLLEVASGTGQHAHHLALNLPGLTVQPTDFDPRAELPEGAKGRMHAPMQLDVLNESHISQLAPCSYDALLCLNMVHISPPECTPGLMHVARHALKAGGKLFMYGPFLVDGKPTTESNTAFDAKLKGMDPCYGLKDIAHVTAVAREHVLVVGSPPMDMPANNFMLTFVKA